MTPVDERVLAEGTVEELAAQIVRQERELEVAASELEESARRFEELSRQFEAQQKMLRKLEPWVADLQRRVGISPRKSGR